MNINPIYPPTLQHGQARARPLVALWQLSVSRDPGGGSSGEISTMFTFDCLALALTPDSSGALLHNILLLHNNTPYCLFPSSIFNSVSSDVRASL